MKMMSPGKIGSMELKNRIIYAPMGSHIDNFGPRSYEYFLDRARGGAAMITIPIFNKELVEYAVPSLTITPENKELCKNLVDEIHNCGAKVCFQIVPGYGRIMPSAVHHSIPVSASAVPALFDPTILCHELTVEEIRDIQKGYVQVVEEVMDIGGDSIEIHAYGGYITDQFLSAVFNKRTDEYGGDIEGRAQFLLELVDIVLKRCGNDYPLLVKYTPAHYVEAPGYRTIEEGIELSKMLEKAGAKLLHVDAGSFENHYVAMPPIYQQEQVLQLRSSEIIKRHVSVPVATNGKLGDLEKGETALLQNKVDFLMIGRGLLADPELPNKIADNRPEDVRPCIGCNECINQVTAGSQIVCTVNPEAGYETQRKLAPTKGKKKILVVGGGPGGMSAALDAQKAGHQVMLWEQGTQLGGMIIPAGRPGFKQEVSDLTEWFRRQVAKSQLPVRYNCKATTDMILEYAPDAVIIATGAASRMDYNIPGLGGSNVVSAIDAMLDRATLGQQIVIVGAGLVGCETALHLSPRGKKITLIEMADKLLPEPIFYMNETMLRQMLATDPNINTRTGIKLLSADETGARVQSAAGEEIIPCDTVVLAMGMCCNDDFGALEGKISTYRIGDCCSPRHIIETVQEARQAVQSIG